MGEDEGSKWMLLGGTVFLFIFAIAFPVHKWVTLLRLGPAKNSDTTHIKVSKIISLSLSPIQH